MVAIEATLVGSESRKRARSVARIGSIDNERRRPMARDSSSTAGLAVREHSGRQVGRRFFS